MKQILGFSKSVCSVNLNFFEFQFYSSDLESRHESDDEKARNDGDKKKHRKSKHKSRHGSDKKKKRKKKNKKHDDKEKTHRKKYVSFCLFQCKSQTLTMTNGVA